MRFSILLVCILAVFATCAQKKPNKKSVVLSATEKNVLVKSHNQAFQALNKKIRDPFVTLGPDGYYYLTGTTAGSHWGDTVGIHVWKSADLATWEDLGFVWTLYGDGKKQESWHFKQQVRHPEYKNPYAIWAPEIHYINGTWWIPHCLNVGGHGLLKSTSGKPEGPYIALDPIQTKRIDSHLFQDNDGSVHYCYQADFMAPMNQPMDNVTHEFTKLQHNGKHPVGYEGILILRFDDKYVHIASGRYGYEFTNSYDLYYTVSKNLYGPYGKRRKAIVNAGHGNLFKDKQGKWWSTAFDHEFTNQWSLWLVPIDIELTENDVLFHVKDKRFAVTQQDQKTVEELSVKGIPHQWEGRAPWWRKDGK